MFRAARLGSECEGGGGKPAQAAGTERATERLRNR